MKEIRYNHTLDILYFPVFVEYDEKVADSVFEQDNRWMLVRNGIACKADEMFRSKLDNMFSFFIPRKNDLIGNYIPIRTAEYEKKANEQKEVFYKTKEYYNILIDKIAYYESLVDDMRTSGALDKIWKIQDIFGISNVHCLRINQWNTTVNLTVRANESPFNQIFEKDISINTDEETLKGLKDLMTRKNDVINKCLQIKDAVRNILGHSYLVNLDESNDGVKIYINDKNKPSESHIIYEFSINELDEASESYRNVEKEIDNKLRDANLSMVCFPKNSVSYLATDDIKRDRLIDRVATTGCAECKPYDSVYKGS